MNKRFALLVLSGGIIATAIYVAEKGAAALTLGRLLTIFLVVAIAAGGIALRSRLISKLRVDARSGADPKH